LDIIDLASPASPRFNPDLCVRGRANRNPGTSKNLVTLFNRGERINANADVALPAAIAKHLKFWQPQLLKLPRAHAMVYSKGVIIDPLAQSRWL
jgi:hypothetical protein